MTDPVRGLVSTIIPVHNRPQLLREAVASVLAQTYRPIEIVIVNDGSEDDTGAICEQLALEHASLITVIHQANSGPATARQAGLEHCTGEFIQYLDSDDLLLPNKFASQVAGPNNQPDCDVSYGMTRRYRIGDPVADVPNRRTGEYIETLFPSMLQSRWWNTSTPLYRRSICDRAGPWNPQLHNEEDWEFDCRVAALGTRLHFVPEFVSEHRDHEGEQLHATAHTEQTKLRSRARAHALMLRHAQRAGITTGQPQMQHFARELFLLGRQCGAQGLGTQSQELFALAMEASTPERASGWDFKLYRFGARIVGWQACGRISKYFDLLRDLIAR
jgi:glycosyltransferase involved in cell wall biosynthesis